MTSLNWSKAIRRIILTLALALTLTSTITSPPAKPPTDKAQPTVKLFTSICATANIGRYREALANCEKHPPKVGDAPA